MSTAGLYFFDLLFVFTLYGVYLGDTDLHVLHTSQPIVSISSAAFALIASPSIYGIRLATYIAMFRRNRAPQPFEWLAFLVPLAVALPFFVASGHFVKWAASAQDYKFCYQQGFRAVTYTFSKQGVPCPPEPKDIGGD